MPRPSHSFHGENIGNQKVVTLELAFERHVDLLQDNLGGGNVTVDITRRWSVKNGDANMCSI
jgi:hypothetical protein